MLSYHPSGRGKSAMKWFKNNKALSASISCFLAAFVLAFYFMGCFQFGRESYTIQSEDRISHWRSGYSAGSKTVYLSKGETFFLSYTTEIREGSLSIQLYKTHKEFGKSDSVHHKLTISGQGELEFPISESCFYSLIVEPHPSPKRYDLSYTVVWGTR